MNKEVELRFSEQLIIRLPRKLLKEINEKANEKLSTPSQIAREAIKKGLEVM